MLCVPPQRLRRHRRRRVRDYEYAGLRATRLDREGGSSGRRRYRLILQQAKIRGNSFHPIPGDRNMDGMMVQTHSLSASGPDREYTSGSHQINLPSPTAVIAEISVSSFGYLYGSKMDAGGYFTACTTDGSNPPKPASETFGFGSISGPPRQVVIRKGLTSLTYEVDVQNCAADFTINVFFWPDVESGNL
jgi:hypothetical protein